MPLTIENLTPQDKGRWVTYTDASLGYRETGRIKSWNANNVFVVFKCDNRWSEFENYTGESCAPEDLAFWEEEAQKDMNYTQEFMRTFFPEMPVRTVEIE